MYWLLNPRVWIAAALVAFLGFTHFSAYRAGKGVVRAAWDADIAQRTKAALEAEKAARAKEQHLLSQRQQAEARYVAEKRKAADAAASAKSDLDRLRDELAKPAPVAAACDPAAASRIAGASRLERDLFGACAAALADLATEADRLEARIVGLQSYVRDVCLKR